MGADGTHAQQAQAFAAQHAGEAVLPLPGLLGLPARQDAPLVQQQVGQNVLGHQRAEDAARIGQDIIPPQVGGQQRLNPGPGGLHPAQPGQARRQGFRFQRLGDQARLAEDDLEWRAARDGSRVRGGNDGQVGQPGICQQALVFRGVFGEDQQMGHD